MGKIIIIRHGQTDYNVRGLLQGREEVPLNEAGVKEADEASYHLARAFSRADFKVDKIITSPLSRASVTARAIGEAIGVFDITEDERLIERDFGILSGAPYTKGSSVVLEDISEPSVERVEQIIFRVNSLIFEKIKKDENAILVTHGAVARIYAKNAKKGDGVDENSIGIMGNLHLGVYSYNGKEMILEAYDIAPREFGV